MRKIPILIFALFIFATTSIFAAETVNKMPQNSSPEVIREVVNIKVIKNETLGTLGKKVLGKNIQDTVFIFIPEAKNDAKFFVIWLAFFTLSFIGFIILALLTVALLEKYILKIAKNIETKLLKSFLIGLLGMVLIVPIAIVLFISIIGIFLIPVEIIFVILMFLLGFIVVAHIIGDKILKALKSKNESIIWSTLLGLVVLWFILWIPVIGVIVKILVMTIGFGAVILTIFQKLRS